MLLVFGGQPAGPVPQAGAVTIRTIVVGDASSTGVADVQGLITERFDARPGTVYLIRPDQHVAARWRSFDAAKIQAALLRCLAA